MKQWFTWCRRHLQKYYVCYFLRTQLSCQIGE